MTSRTLAALDTASPQLRPPVLQKAGGVGNSPLGPPDVALRRRDAQCTRTELSG
jgi:hypothetical protein